MVAPDLLRERIERAVAAYREQIVEFAQELIALPTENPPGHGYEACARAIAARIGALGLACEFLPVSGAPPGLPRYWLSARAGARDRSAPTLYFHGHYDVVPAARAEQYRPHIADGRLHGRGSADMKGGLAAMIYAVKALGDSGVALSGAVALTIVPDEETGGAYGSRYLASTGLLGVGGVGMLTPEPTGGVIWNANRGALTLRVSVRGRPAHVGQHYEGINAFERMLVVAGALLELKGEIERHQTDFAVRNEIARRSILMLGGECSGGANFNIVPALCTFTVERRINPEEDLATEKSRLFALFDRLRASGIDLEVDVLQEGSPAGVPEEHPVARALAASVADVTGHAPEFALCPGLLEIRFYAEQGVPAFAYGPGNLSFAHGPDEQVAVDDLISAATIYALTAARLLGA